MLDSFSGYLDHGLNEFEQSAIDPEKAAHPLVNGLIIGQRPLCDELPWDLDEMTATMELNRPKAIALLALRHHADTIDVSLALAQHSLYYKVAQKCKYLDRLLLYRMKQAEEEENDGRILHEEDRAKGMKELAVRGRCYSSDCQNGYLNDACYSWECRRFAKLEELIKNATTTAPHRLKVPPLSTGSTGQKKVNTKVWTKENSVAMPPPPRVQTFRTSSMESKAEANVLVLPKHVARRLARKAGVQDVVEGFSHTGKWRVMFGLGEVHLTMQALSRGAKSGFEELW